MGTCPHRALRDGQILPIQDDDTEVLGQRPPPRPAASCSDCRGDLPVGDSWPGPVSVSRSASDTVNARISMTTGWIVAVEGSAIGTHSHADERAPPHALEAAYDG